MAPVENMVAESQRTRRRRAQGSASILAIATANPPNIFYQTDYPDFYFGVTQSDHLTQLKDKFKRICKCITSILHHTMKLSQLFKAWPGGQRCSRRPPAHQAPRPSTLCSKTHDLSRRLLRRRHRSPPRQGHCREQCGRSCSRRKLELMLMPFHAPSNTYLGRYCRLGTLRWRRAAVIVGAILTKPRSVLFELVSATQKLISDSADGIVGHVREMGLQYFLSKTVMKKIADNILQCCGEAFSKFGVGGGTHCSTLFIPRAVDSTVWRSPGKGGGGNGSELGCAEGIQAEVRRLFAFGPGAHGGDDCSAKLWPVRDVIIFDHVESLCVSQILPKPTSFGENSDSSRPLSTANSQSPDDYRADSVGFAVVPLTIGYPPLDIYLHLPSMATVDAAPSLDILVREPEGFYVWGGPPFNNGQPSMKLEKVPCTKVKFSEDGSRLLVMTSESGIGIYDCCSLKEIKSFQVPAVGATLSPCGTYLQTFQKSSTPQEKNLVLWKTDTGDAVYNLFQKHMTKDTWPSIRFSSDEAVACRVATNEIQFFDAKDFAKGILYRLRIPGVAAFELSKAPGTHVATFVPESKGSPASVQIYACDKDSQSQPLARKSFFRCSTVQLLWNHGSTGLLVVVQSDVDKTNQSYYGESKLNYLTMDGTHEGLVPLRKEGPVHDVQWSHSGSEFAVVYGCILLLLQKLNLIMPASATVFDKRCRPLLELGSGPYNTIRLNPKGKFLCLAGFGNLPGDMAFWDYEDKKQLRTTRAELSVTSEWSPDGCYFMTATTAPRLQVDNGYVDLRIKIFHYDGSLYFKKKFEKLFQAEWKPESPDRFGDIAELIKSISTLKVDESKQKGPGSASKKPASANPPATKPAAYRPPHAKQAAAIQAELFGESPSQEMSKNALKNKKKREKLKEKKAAGS
ncbi:hypothetical protein Pint_26123 [Pistacia integerrima]|uniref:Uncharacterized protein n=1 Tax=Pistacia integerrima TaxID=434235 RepID=A0ACC0YGA5_9ROSI|nr:hypothetical protein Pint_26123 [Pistacia integerrima]